jgi:magnesium chelatase family protein
VPAVPQDVLGGTAPGECSAAVRARVVAARECQRERYADNGPRTNADLTPSFLGRVCDLDRDGRRLLGAAVSKMGLSARGYDRVRKVARTIADLSGYDRVAADHIAEALQFRAPS